MIFFRCTGFDTGSGGGSTEVEYGEVRGGEGRKGRGVGAGGRRGKFAGPVGPVY